MARTADQVLANIVGDYVTQIALLVAQVETLRERVAELEKPAAPAPLNPPDASER